ncbi:MAG: histidine kinase [Bacteroidota bacterium]
MKFTKTRNIKWNIIILHVFSWSVLISLPYAYHSELDPHFHINEETYSLHYLESIINIFWIIVFYLNAFLIIPRFLYAKNYLVFIAIQIVFFAMVVLLRRPFYTFLIQEYASNFFISVRYSLAPFLGILAAAIAFRAISDKAEAERVEAEMKQENLKAELTFLRGQISPHFLFNVLNNIIALVRKNSDDLEPTLIKLSSLIRYMLYKTREKKVPVHQEVEYLHNYIHLQKQRFAEKLVLEEDIILEGEHNMIEPMLLITFVENAFKHGTGHVQDPHIKISLRENHNSLFFNVKNRHSKAPLEKKDISGIGLANVRRRLELIYGANHKLDIHEMGEWFEIKLSITFEV